uniref:Putative ovule protein n=1 Tax=Solanum chacoense TaxID=4108 RepID=A0A0V0IF08_SOLCH
MLSFARILLNFIVTALFQTCPLEILCSGLFSCALLHIIKVSLFLSSSTCGFAVIVQMVHISILHVWVYLLCLYM